LTLVEIRLEQPADHRAAEEVVREAFWNFYVPGCDEHWLLHAMRGHPDFLPELDFVALENGRLVGNIVYCRSSVVDALGASFPAITFGPVAVLPEFQGRGIGAALIRHSLHVAKKLGHTAVFIYGYPAYYQRFGFVGGSRFGIGNGEGKFPTALQALELVEDTLRGVCGSFVESAVYHIDPAEVAAFDKGFAPKEKGFAESQRDFERMLVAFDEPVIKKDSGF
jgi:predicted N-acetyltransferase YhbS